MYIAYVPPRVKELLESCEVVTSLSTIKYSLKIVQGVKHTINEASTAKMSQRKINNNETRRELTYL